MKLLDWVLALYPRDFRGRFGEGMRTALNEDYRRARSRGRLAALLFLTTTIPHALWFGLVERLPRPATIHAFFTIDTRDAVRALAATPIVTIVSVLSLALGIGANTALFSILNSLVIKQLPVRAPEQLVVLDRTSWPNPIWEQIRERQHDLFESAGAWSTAPTTFNLAESGRVEPVNGAYVSGGLFHMLGIDAIAGRTITPADDVRGGGPDGLVAVISSRFGQSRFGGARDALGRQLTLNRVRFTVVGILPPGFLGPEVGEAMDVFVPLASEAAIRGRESALDFRNSWWLQMMARLKPDQSLDQAMAALNAARPAIREATMPLGGSAESRARYFNEPISLFPAATGVSPPRGLRERFEQPLTIIMMVVAAVLFIACANIANLMLARATARRHELSVRLALGASRLRLGCQMFIESLILAAGGGLAGLALAEFGGPLLVRQLGSDLSAATLDLSIDWRVLGFTAAASLGATFLFGLAPALGLGRVQPNDAMKEQSRAVAGESRLGLRNALVAAQVGLSFALVVGAGLFVRTFATLTTTPLGFDPSNLLIVGADATPDSVTPENKVAYAQRVAEAVAAVPGVARASLSRITPMSDGNTTTGVQLSGATPLPPEERTVWINFIEQGWFETYGMRVIAGRDFAVSDTGAEAVAVVNQAFVRRFANGQNVIGQQVTSVTPGRLNALIVGVVNDSVYRTVRLGVVPTMYLPVSRASLGGFSGSAFSVTAKLTSPRALVERNIADAIGKAAPDLAFTFRDYNDQLRATVIQERLVALMSGFFGALAMLLAALGVYGVTAYSVGRRRAEIAVRMALGASSRRVVRLVLGRVAMLILAGAAIGVALSLWAARFVGALLFGVGARDPVTLVTAAAILVSVGLFAGWLPARTVSRLDPTTALRT
ncbi:MAG TPA: ABC transporter permease [Vicinamibacterales bacterium]|nr:ABC transporter permease [Vicinamibacterales bacterium]